MLNTNPKHVGLENDLIDTIDTIVEIYLFKNANKIKTYSIYGWISGFSKYLSIIFNKRFEHII